MSFERENTKTAFLDVDGTLISGTSLERQLIRRLLSEGLMSPMNLIRFTAVAMTGALTGGTDALKKTKAYYRGLEVDELERFIPSFFDSWIEPRLRPAMLEEIERLRKDGFALVLLSGTTMPLLRELGRRLGIDTLIGSELEEEDGTYTGRSVGIHPYGEGKLDALEAYGALDGRDLTAAAAYGDSWQDRFLLERVGEPVAVAPDLRLRSLAKKRGWRILPA